MPPRRQPASASDDAHRSPPARFRQPADRSGRPVWGVWCFGGSGFGIRDSGFGIRDSGFGIRDSGFGIRDWSVAVGLLRGLN
ncbi:MAG: hypothetical protein DI597_07895 [Pseudoxanthomonas spadix]|nr:MAG: hypothetical protein DI597_07895 [Pseudoxanthomonas spadix]